MADVVNMGTLFNPELVTELFTTVRGTSVIAQLCNQEPIGFTGNEEMVFSMDDEVSLVGESEKKTAGSMKLEPVIIIPKKVEYGARVSREFMYATEEKQLDILSAFNDGFSKKVATGLDLMAIHGVNPRNMQPSSLITSSFKSDVKTIVEYDATAPDDNLQDVIDKIEDYDVTGIALSKNFSSAMGKIKSTDESHVRVYPEFGFGQKLTSFYGTPCAVSVNVSKANNIQAIVGDFADAFKWGFAKEIPLEIIPYGDPDNTGVDLAGSNQVYLRAEAYIGWGILDPTAFAMITGAISPNSVKTTSKKAE